MESVDLTVEDGLLTTEDFDTYTVSVADKVECVADGVVDVTNCVVDAILVVLPLSSSIAVLMRSNSFLISFLTVSTSSMVDRDVV